MDLSTINFLAIIVVTIISFVLGSLWYTVLFGKKWQKEVGLSDDDIKNDNMAKTFGTSFVLMFLMNFALAFIFSFVDRQDFDFAQGAMYGAFIGLFFNGLSYGINMLYQKKSFSLWLIDSSYQILYLAVSGAILAVWK